jgi:membrane protein DedA with SNARE-associated domain
MKTRYTVVLSMMAGATLGAAVDFVPGLWWRSQWKRRERRPT